MSADTRGIRELFRQWLNKKHFTSDGGVTLDCLAMLPDEHALALTIGQLSELAAAFAESIVEQCCNQLNTCADQFDEQARQAGVNGGELYR